VYGRNSQGAVRYDHYASELSLLYINILACLELQVLEAMAGREPQVAIYRWTQVQTDIQRSRSVADHLWFPDGRPHAFDQVQEANRRGVTAEGKLVPFTERPRPEDLSDDEVLYYANPLRRLIHMHSGVNELTGFAWQSPWYRPNALLRSID